MMAGYKGDLCQFVLDADHCGTGEVSFMFTYIMNDVRNSLNGVKFKRYDNNKATNTRNFERFNVVQSEHDNHRINEVLLLDVPDEYPQRPETPLVKYVEY